MSVDHLYFEWWVDDECLGLWIRHKCLNGEIKEWHPDSRWTLTLDGPRPSLDCADCGRHTILTNADHRDRVANPIGDTDGSVSR